MWKPGTFQKTEAGVVKIIKIETAIDKLAETMFIAAQNQIRKSAIPLSVMYDKASYLILECTKTQKRCFPELPAGYTMWMIHPKQHYQNNS